MQQIGDHLRAVLSHWRHLERHPADRGALDAEQRHLAADHTLPHAALLHEALDCNRLLLVLLTCHSINQSQSQSDTEWFLTNLGKRLELLSSNEPRYDCWRAMESQQPIEMERHDLAKVRLADLGRAEARLEVRLYRYQSQHP